MNNGFYELKQFDTTAKLIEFYEDAIAVADSVVVHKLDCNVSWSRKIDKEFTIYEILDKFLSPTSHNTFIDKDVQHPNFNEKFELCVSTLHNEPSYFGYIFISRVEGNKLIKKYKLKQMKY